MFQFWTLHMEIVVYLEWMDLRDVNEKTRTYEDRTNFRDLNKISECEALFVWEA